MPVFKRRKPDDADPALPAGIDDAASSEPGESRVTNLPADSGLGVPPFRPAPPKEAPIMPRSPFPTATPTPGAGNPGTPTPAAGALRPAVATTSPRPASRDPSERRMLVVGRGISVQGTVQDAERLVVEGTVEASMIHATELAIAQGGMFKGEVEVEDAEVSGTFNGTLTARGNLIIRSTGRVLGQARYRRLQVEDGGQISGQMEMLTDGAKAEAPTRVAVPEQAA